MVSSDEYTVHVAVHHLEADAMAKLVRQQPGDLFVIELREVQDARSTTSIPINNPSGRLRYEIL
jgi:hypothetical protein